MQAVWLRCDWVGELLSQAAGADPSPLCPVTSAASGGSTPLLGWHPALTVLLPT